MARIRGRARGRASVMFGFRIGVAGARLGDRDRLLFHRLVNGHAILVRVRARARARARVRVRARTLALA